MHLHAYANIYLQMKRSYPLFSDTIRSVMPNRLTFLYLFLRNGPYNSTRRRLSAVHSPCLFPPVPHGWRQSDFRRDFGFEFSPYRSTSFLATVSSVRPSERTNRVFMPSSTPVFRITTIYRRIVSLKKRFAMPQDWTRRFQSVIIMRFPDITQHKQVFCYIKKGSFSQKGFTSI